MYESGSKKHSDRLETHIIVIKHWQSLFFITGVFEEYLLIFSFLLILVTNRQKKMSILLIKWQIRVQYSFSCIITRYCMDGNKWHKSSLLIAHISCILLQFQSCLNFIFFISDHFFNYALCFGHWCVLQLFCFYLFFLLSDLKCDLTSLECDS